MEIKRLCAENYDELLDVLNRTFSKKNNKTMNFLAELPKMWVRDDEHMGHHLGVFEDGKLCSVVGIYPLSTVIDGEEFLFATTGNVATLPEYEGRGYFNLLFEETMLELERIGADAARLSGPRQRYGRFGYEHGGTVYEFVFVEHNRQRCYGENAGDDVSFSLICAEDKEAIAFCRELSERRDIRVKRSLANAYLTLSSKSNTPYLALRNGKMIGYLTASEKKDRLGEINAASVEDMIGMLCAWQKQNTACVSFELPCYMTEEVRAFSASANRVNLSSASQFKVINWQKLLNALMRTKAKKEKLPDGELTLEISGYGRVRLYVEDGKAGCEATEKAHDVSLDRLTATRLLLGPMPPSVTTELPPIPRSWLPLPMSWNMLDSV